MEEMRTNFKIVFACSDNLISNKSFSSDKITNLFFCFKKVLMILASWEMELRREASIPRRLSH